MYSGISDRIRIVSFLAGVNDFSDELQRHALTMLEFVYSECIAGKAFCQTAIQDAHLNTNPALDAEVRLHQLRFYLLEAATGRQLSVEGLQFSPVAGQIGDTELLASLDKVEDSVRHYPSTCKPYLKAVPEFRRMLLDQSPNIPDLMTYIKRMPRIFSTGVREIEKRRSKHIVLGAVTTCDVKHVYSAENFPDFCPECGKREETEQEKLERARSHLFEEEFLAVMHRTGSSASLVIKK